MALKMASSSLLKKQTWKSFSSSPFYSPRSGLQNLSEWTRTKRLLWNLPQTNKQTKEMETMAAALWPLEFQVSHWLPDQQHIHPSVTRHRFHEFLGCADGNPENSLSMTVYAGWTFLLFSGLVCSSICFDLPSHLQSASVDPLFK